MHGEYKVPGGKLVVVDLEVADAILQCMIGEYMYKYTRRGIFGGAEKRQIQAMMGVLLPGAKLSGPDAADALAVAITHAQLRKRSLIEAMHRGAA